MRVSSSLNGISLLLWVVSLALPAIVQFDGTMPGIMVGAIGWIAILAWVPAWLANPFFLYAVLRMSMFDPPKPVPSAIACLCGLTTYYGLHIGYGYHGSGSTLNVYGLGWGAVAWMVAVTLPLIASGIRAVELQQKPLTLSTLLRSIPTVIGVIVLTGILSVSAALGLHDHMKAQGMDRVMLRYAVFKGGAVCEVPDVMPQNSIPLNGPLEIVTADDRNTLLTEADTLLSWGIPRVRKDGWEYYLTDPQDASSVAMVAATDRPGPRLEISHHPITDYRYSIHARLTSADGRIIGFDGEWDEPAPMDKFYCPHYSTAPAPDEPPRSLLLATLTPPAASGWHPVPRKNARQARTFRATRIQVIGHVNRSDMIENQGCPAEIGVRHPRRSVAAGRLEEVPWAAAYGRSELFQVGRRYYWGAYDVVHHMLCIGNIAYIYHLEMFHPTSFRIVRRQIPGFRKVDGDWEIRIDGDAPESLKNPVEIYIQSLEEEGDRLLLVASLFGRDEQSSWRIRIDARASSPPAAPPAARSHEPVPGGIP